MKSIVGDLTLDAVVTNVRSKRRRIQFLLSCLSSDRCLKFISNIHLIFSLIFFNSMFCVDMFVLMICIFLIICGQQVPWGVQTGKNVDLQAIYEIVLRTAWYCLKPGGRFVMLVLRGTKMLWLLWWWSLSLWLLPFRIDFSTCCFAVLFCARFANDADFEKIKWAVQIVVDSSRSHHQQHAVCGGGGKIRTRFGARNIETSIVRHESIRQHQSRNVRAIDFCFFFTWVVLL